MPKIRTTHSKFLVKFADARRFAEETPTRSRDIKVTGDPDADCEVTTKIAVGSASSAQAAQKCQVQPSRGE
eukprot:933873-Pyramimonas_sp.AAC.1